MNPESKKILADVKTILNSGNDRIINTLKLTLRAYLACIEQEDRADNICKKIADLKCDMSFLRVEIQKRGHDVRGGLGIVRRDV